MNNKNNLTVTHLTPDHFNVAASLIYQAYLEDPVFKHILEADKSQAAFEKKLRAVVREELHSFWEAKQALIGLFVDDKLTAVTCLFDSQASMQAGRYWHWRLKLMLSAGYLSTSGLIEKEETIRNALATLEPYTFLAFIAVDKHYQRSGFGHHILSALDSLLEENTEQKGLAVFVTRDEHKAFFAAHDYQALQQLAFSKVTGELMFKENPHLQI